MNDYLTTLHQLADQLDSNGKPHESDAVRHAIRRIRDLDRAISGALLKPQHAKAILLKVKS